MKCEFTMVARTALVPHPPTVTSVKKGKGTKHDMILVDILLLQRCPNQPKFNHGAMHIYALGCPHPPKQSLK